MKKKKIVTILIAIVVLIIAIILIILGNKNANLKIDIDKYAWDAYQNNLDNIKMNMDNVAESNKDQLWFKLKDYKTNDAKYKTKLTNLVIDVKICYQNYTERNDLRKYLKGKRTISKIEFNELKDNMKEFSCLKRFDMYKLIVISEDADKEKEFLNTVKNVEDFNKNFDINLVKTPQELILYNIAESNMISNLSYWILGKYYNNK